MSYIAIAREGAKGVGIDAAVTDAHVDRGTQNSYSSVGYGDAARGQAALGDTKNIRVITVIGAEGLAYLVWVLRHRHRSELIEICLSTEMGSATPDVGDYCDRIPCNFMLDVEVPLLNVGPNRFGGDGGYAEG